MEPSVGLLELWGVEIILYIQSLAVRIGTTLHCLIYQIGLACLTATKLTMVFCTLKFFLGILIQGKL